NIDVIFVEGSGCYGHNGADPVTQDAAILSQAVGKPVRVQYSRADEMIGGEHYGHPMVSNEKAGLDANGTIIAWDYENILRNHRDAAWRGRCYRQRTRQRNPRLPRGFPHNTRDPLNGTANQSDGLQQRLQPRPVLRQR